MVKVVFIMDNLSYINGIAYSGNCYHLLRDFDVMQAFRKFIFWTLFLFLFSSVSYTQSDRFAWNEGEELIYKVKWGFLRLGTLKIQVLDPLQIDDQKIFHIRLYLDSNPMLFFVNMHSIYDTFIDEDLRPYMHLAQEKIDNIDYRSTHYLNYRDSTLYSQIINLQDSTQNWSDTIRFDQPLYDGISMTYYARATTENVRRDTLLSYFGDKHGNVLINFRGKQRSPFNRWAKEQDHLYFVDGNIMMVGIAGLTGPFMGWFSANPQRIPLRAQLKVFLGNVHVELEQTSQVNVHTLNQDENIQKVRAEFLRHAY